MSDSETEDEDLTVPRFVKRSKTYHGHFQSGDSETEDEDLSVAPRIKTLAAIVQHPATDTLEPPLNDPYVTDRVGLMPRVVKTGVADKISSRSTKCQDSTTTRHKSERIRQQDSCLSDPETEDHHDHSDRIVLASPVISDDDDDDDSRESEKPFFKGKPLGPKSDILVGQGSDKTVLPGCTAQWLRPYQIDGILFMYDLYTSRSGGILGDDMGLGKTVQVIGFLNAVFGKDGSYSDWKRMREKRATGEKYPVVMIICPGSLIDNWIHELDTWSWTHIARYHGVGRHAALQSIAQGRLEVLITTYTTYKNNCAVLNQVDWHVVIADECHIIKEKSSKVTQSANEVNSKCRIGLTGTAIQNNYDELYTLLNWTNPGKYGSASAWYREISSVLKNGQKHNATNYELNRARIKALELSKNLLPRVLLRRTKALIAHQLPKKIDKVVFCPLTQLQITAYDNLMDSEEMTFLRDAKQPCDCGSSTVRLLCCHTQSPSGQSFAELLFPYLHYLRNLSNHMALCLPRQNDPPRRRERDQTLLIQAVPDHWRALVGRTPMVNGSDPELCGKWKVLRQLLVLWKREGSKVLIFSSSVQLLDMLNDLMVQEGYLYEYLHGSMSLDARTAAVTNFNTNPSQFIFLISTRAGGVGLNIVSANKVVIFDPNWNPAHDLQAQDRAYRIGQTRDVEVFRLISVGTVEETVYARQVYKQQQANIGYSASEERRYFNGVQGDPEQRGELFGIENLLTFHGDNLVLQRIFQGTEDAESKFGGIRISNIEAPIESIANHDISDTESGVAGAGGSGGVDEFGIKGIIDDELTSLTPRIPSHAHFQSTHPQHAKSVTRRNDEDTAESVEKILAGAGVRYSHRVDEVIGTSIVESRISRVAATAARDFRYRDRKAYLPLPPTATTTTATETAKMRGGGGGGGVSARGVGSLGKMESGGDDFGQGRSGGDADSRNVSKEVGKSAERNKKGRTLPW